MKKGIIFDLDQTLVDSNIAKSYRSARDWNIVYSLISKFVLYEAYDKVFEFIRDNAEDVISFGDEVSDVIASNGAGIESVACLWGSANEESLLGSDADHVIYTPNEIISLLK